MRPRKYTVESLVGKEFGDLKYLGETRKVSERIPGAKGYESKWQCACGAVVVIRDRDVVNGATKSCGCRRKQIGKKCPRFRGHEEISGAFWNSVLSNARQRKKTVEVSLQEVWEKFLQQNRRCALTGVALMFETMSGKHDGTASLDRIDSSKGYTTKNVQWVHKNVNYIKRDLPNDEFIEWCKKVAKHNNGA